MPAATMTSADNAMYLGGIFVIYLLVESIFLCTVATATTKHMETRQDSLSDPPCLVCTY